MLTANCIHDYTTNKNAIWICWMHQHSYCFNTPFSMVLPTWGCEGSQFKAFHGWVLSALFLHLNLVSRPLVDTSSLPWILAMKAQQNARARQRLDFGVVLPRPHRKHKAMMLVALGESVSYSRILKTSLNIVCGELCIYSAQCFRNQKEH